MENKEVNLENDLWFIKFTPQNQASVGKVYERLTGKGETFYTSYPILKEYEYLLCHIVGNLSYRITLYGNCVKRGFIVSDKRISSYIYKGYIEVTTEQFLEHFCPEIKTNKINYLMYY